jgi:hypothetical protein
LAYIVNLNIIIILMMCHNWKSKPTSFRFFILPAHMNIDEKIVWNSSISIRVLMQIRM